jgi:hypothetical protein
VLIGKIHPPSKRPDLYDAYDNPAKSPKLSKEYLDAVTPEHVKKIIVEVEAKKSKK